MANYQPRTEEWKAAMRKPRRTVVCICGKAFEDKEDGKRKYCSYECSWGPLGKAKRKQVTLTCVICNATFSVRLSRVDSAKYCDYECHQVGEGRKGGKIGGAVMHARSQGKAYLKTQGRHTHRVLMEQILGRPLVRGEIVHHIDGNKLNNDPSNLQLLASQADHARLHAYCAKRRVNLNGH